MKTHIAVLGSNGMVGRALQRLSLERGKEDERWVFCTRKEVDLRDEARLTQWFTDNSITHVINVAAVVGGLTFNISHPLRLLDENLRLATSVLGACHAAGVQHMVSVLSTCIFPDKHCASFSEEHLFDGAPHDSNAGYAYSKRILFSLSRAYALKHGRNYTCVAPPNLYGPHDRFDEEQGHVVGALIGKFFKAEQSGVKKVEVYGTGVARRQFMFCDDLAFLLVWALHHYKDTLSPVIVAPDGDILIKDLVTTIAGNFESDIEVEWDATKPDGQITKKASNKKMRGFLAEWAPTPLDVGIRKTVEWYKSQSSK